MTGAAPGAPAWTGVVLCGGASTRMGRDKALVEVDGEPLAARIAGAMRRAGAGVTIAVGGDLPSLVALGLDAVPDDHPGEGPLGGILTAFGQVRTEVVVVLACDLPGAEGASVAAVVDALLCAPDAAVAWPEDEGHAHVLHAAWRPALAGPPLAAAFAAGERSPRRAAARLDRVVVLDLAPASLRNANRPEDLQPGPLPPTRPVPPAAGS